MAGWRLETAEPLAWCEYGPRDGRPLLHFQGMPSSRKFRHYDETAYERHNVRFIAFDRPGFVASSRLPGREVSVVAHDATALLDHLGLEEVHVIGRSGGGAHLLAFAALHPERVRAATVVAGGVLVQEDELDGFTEVSREGWYAVRRRGWDAVYERVALRREALLSDPLAGARAMLHDASPADLAVMGDPAWQRVHAEDVAEALRPGAEGCADT